jgi:hypothetical protein
MCNTHTYTTCAQELQQSNAELESTMHVALETSSTAGGKKVKDAEELKQARKKYIS